MKMSIFGFPGPIPGGSGILKTIQLDSQWSITYSCLNLIKLLRKILLYTYENGQNTWENFRFSKPKMSTLSTIFSTLSMNFKKPLELPEYMKVVFHLSLFAPL